MDFIVTTSTRTTARKQIWRAEEPLKIGFPMQWVMESTTHGIRITYLGGRAEKVFRDRIREISHEELRKNPKLLLKTETDRGFELRVQPTLRTAAHFGWAAQTIVDPARRLPLIDLEHDKQTSVFKKSLRASAVALAALIVLSLIWPKAQPHEEELIPPQLAKIILTPPKHRSAAAESASARGNTPNSVQKKVRETAVVQAFRAKALQSAVSKLMKGGMTRLLAQSDFVAGHRQTAEVNRLMDFQSKDLQASSPEIGGLASKTLAVASLGGSGVPGQNGKIIGYAKGEHASVSGQGKGFVSLDMANSSVEEGLTKDEVGEVIHRHLSEVRYCYESAMIRMPDIEGKLMVDFSIGGDGVVKTAEAKQSTLPDPRLDDCIIRRLITWKFPLPKGGITVAVTYPFIFKTLGR